MRRPFNGDYRITQGFYHISSVTGKQHGGLDFAMPEGTPVHAPESGRIVFSGFDRGYGVVMVGSHGKHRLWHLSRVAGRPGLAREGDLVGWSGKTGLATGSHLHWDLRQGEKFINPLDYLEGGEGEMLNPDPKDGYLWRQRQVYVDLVEEFLGETPDENAQHSVVAGDVGVRQISRDIISNPKFYERFKEKHKAQLSREFGQAAPFKEVVRSEVKQIEKNLAEIKIAVGGE